MRFETATALLQYKRNFNKMLFIFVQLRFQIYKFKLEPEDNNYQFKEQLRPRAVPIFPLEFVDITNAGARKPLVFLAYSFLRASVRDIFPRLDELKRKIGTAGGLGATQ